MQLLPTEAAHAIAAARIHDAPEPGRSLALELEAERVTVMEPDTVSSVAERPEIAVVVWTREGWG